MPITSCIQTNISCCLCGEWLFDDAQTVTRKEIKSEARQSGWSVGTLVKCPSCIITKGAKVYSMHAHPDIEFSPEDFFKDLGQLRQFKDIGNFWKCEHSGYKKFRSQCHICDGVDAALGF